MNKLRISICSSLFFCALVFNASSLFAQRGKDLNGSLSGTLVVNTYTNIAADVILNATSLTVASNAMTGGAFGATALAAGDLILIIQMQGASIDTDNAAMPGNNFAYPTEFSWPADWSDPTAQFLYGKVNALNGAGKFQYAEVASISGGTIINVDCPLLTAFSATGKTQVVRIPRYNDLLLNATAVVNPLTWSGTIGGVVAIEVNGTLTMTAGSKISASGFGFRGGAVNMTSTSTNSTNSVGSVSYYAVNNNISVPFQAIGTGAKGESIAGSNTDYLTISANAGRGSIANGGGGGSEHNSGGGGGSNVGNTATWTGRGNSAAGYAAIWDLEFVGMSTATSSGGGRGGYTMAAPTTIPAIATTPPNNALWLGDKRRVMGGIGGHTLQYSVDRAFLGGGGGAADANNSTTATISQGNGGKGGGIIFLKTYGIIAGTGTFESNGANGSNCQGIAAGIGQKTGVDGAGGAGAGGSIIINNTAALPGTLTLNAIGGNGGSQLASFGTGVTKEAQGPGGGGAGGLIAFVSGTPIQSVAGGVNGTTNSVVVAGFPPNGATSGGAGLVQAITAYNLTAANVTICSNTTALLTAVYSGTSPGLPSWYTQQYGGASVGTGMTFTTPLLLATTTYYVGFCPGTFRVPVIVTVNPCPLSIELLSFTGEEQRNRNKLTWSTISETNNDHFTLERSLDASVWSDYESIQGAGNSSVIMNYETFDYDFDHPVIYYRLKQTDFDAYFTYSNIVALTQGDVELIDVFPNPIEGDVINLSIVSKVNLELTVIITNTVGQVFTNEIIHVSKGSNLVNIPIIQLSQGTYFIKASSTNGSETIMKQLKVN
jgi:hypothetical protein